MSNKEHAHIGWAVKSIAKARRTFAVLGFQAMGEEIDDVPRGVRIAFVENDAGLSIELIEPMSKESPIRTMLEKNGPIPYHLCFAVSGSWDEVKEIYDRAGFVEATPPASAPALEGRDVVFLYSRTIGLIELIFTKSLSQKGKQ